MFGSLGNIAGLMKSAKELRDGLAKVQAEAASRRFDAEAGGGVVKAVVDGRGMLVSLKIDPKATADVELLEDLIVAATGSATAKSQEAMRAEMAGLTGGINIPGLTEMLGAK